MVWFPVHLLHRDAGTVRIHLLADSDCPSWRHREIWSPPTLLGSLRNCEGPLQTLPVLSFSCNHLYCLLSGLRSIRNTCILPGFRAGSLCSGYSCLSGGTIIPPHVRLTLGSRIPSLCIHRLLSGFHSDPLMFFLLGGGSGQRAELSKHFVKSLQLTPGLGRCS